MTEQDQTIQKVEFRMTEFLGVTIKGAILAVVANLLLVAIGFLIFLISKDKSPLMPEGTFNLITYVLLVFFLGGLSSGGAYARHMWKAGAKMGTLYGAVVGMLIGGIYFPLQRFAINPILSRVLYIPYNNKDSLIQPIIVGVLAGLFFMGCGYMCHMGEEDDAKAKQDTSSTPKGKQEGIEDTQQAAPPDRR